MSFMGSIGSVMKGSELEAAKGPNAVMSGQNNFKSFARPFFGGSCNRLMLALLPCELETNHSCSELEEDSSPSDAVVTVPKPQFLESDKED